MTYLRNYWANPPEYQRVVLNRLGCANNTVVLSICKNKVLNILSCLRNYWANRPECQRVVPSRLGCADYAVVSSICKNMCFKHFVISQKLLGQSTWVSTRCAQQVALRRLHCCFFNLQEYLFQTFCHISETIGPIDLSVSALFSAGWAAPTTLLFLQFARISVLNILSYLRNYWANRPECQRVVLSR